MPEEPVLLLSYINTKLRNTYSDLEELASAEGKTSAEIKDKLSSIDYHYDPDLNQFK